MTKSHSSRKSTCDRFLSVTRALAVVGMVLGSASCLSTRRLDHDVQRVLQREAAVSMREHTNTLTDAASSMAADRGQAVALELDLEGALRLATRYSRVLQDKRDQLVLGGLDRLAALRDFGPQYSGTLGYVLNRPDTGDDTAQTTAGVKASQILPTGGTLSVAADGTAESAVGSTNDAARYTHKAGVELRQPLLAGSGYEASHDKLIQSERDLLYALRTFALERQDFAITVMKSYYGLLISKAVVENTRKNVDQSTFLRRRSEALFRIRRAPSIDVLRSQQQELSAINTLNQTEAQYDVDRRRFLIELGLAADATLNVTGSVPEMRPLDLNLETCMVLAVERRLDLRTEQDKVEDARRGVRIARRALLPKLDAFGKASTTGAASDSFAGGDSADEYSAGVAMELPLDKRPERDALKRALIAEQAAERRLTEKRDSIRVSIMDSFRTLASQRQAADIEFRNTQIAQRQADYAALRFRNGEADNRDVVDAQNQLLNARNTYVKALVQYEQQRIQLLRDVGLLDVATDGRLVERLQP